MPVYLYELQAGSDRHLVGFPHLVLCLGVVVQTRAWLYGFHFDTPERIEAYARTFAGFFQGQGADIANAVALYGCCDFKGRYGGKSNPTSAWKQDLRIIAGELGYRGEARGFDTSILAPIDGSYVEYRPEYQQGRCRIFYKLHLNQDFGSSRVTRDQVRRLSHGNQVHFRRPALGHGDPFVTPGKSQFYTTAQPGVPPPGLQEVDYDNRLLRFTI